MEDSIKVYSLPSCGMCKMLKQQLNNLGIKYTVCEDTEEMRKVNITSVPVLSINGEHFSFKDALKKIKQGELK
jgi:glutaredoxin